MSLFSARNQLAHEKRSSNSVPGAQGLGEALLGAEASPGADLMAGIRRIFIEPISVLLVAWPFAVASYCCNWGPISTFFLSFFALIPLAQILGNITEDLAISLQDEMLSGLLNATFGNAVEMIVTIQTLIAREIKVVKATLLGSILSNLLLVLGCALFAGGISVLRGDPSRPSQKFCKQAASANVSLLLLAATSLALPACFYKTVIGSESHQDMELTLNISRVISFIVLCCYIAFLFFCFVTHKDLQPPEEEDEKPLPRLIALSLLLVTTIVVTFTSEFMVGAIEGIVEELDIGREFIGMILLPIVGNACEHFGAVRMAIADKLDITIAIAVGSATQMSLFVVPFAVLVGWAIDIPMDLNFGALDTIIMCASVILAFSILNDGESNWLGGFMLTAAYLIVGTLYWFYPA